jgi:hypothetical protein
MTTALVVMFLAASAFAQQESGALAACGPKGVRFDVKRDESQHTLVQPDPGKARVHFVQDIGVVNYLGSCSTKIRLDGEWVGANQRNSYFSVSVDPGEHHVWRAWTHNSRRIPWHLCISPRRQGWSITSACDPFLGERPDLEY